MNQGTGGLGWVIGDPYGKNVNGTPKFGYQGPMNIKNIQQELFGYMYPTLMQTYQRYAQSLTPEGKLRLASAFRDKSALDATAMGDQAAAGLMSEGFGSGYTAGARLNAMNRAQRASTQYGASLYDPERDVKGAFDLFAQTAGVYQPQPKQGGGSSFLGDIIGLGGMAAGLGWAPFAASDRRLKSNIVRVGTHPLGIGVYEYDIFGHRERGVMAQELMAVKPSAVAADQDGWLHVDYSQIGGRP